MLPGRVYKYNKNESLKCAAPIDCAVQKVVATSLRAHLLYQSYFWRLVGLLGERNIRWYKKRIVLAAHAERLVYNCNRIAVIFPERSQLMKAVVPCN